MMTVHTEWIKASQCDVDYIKHTDAYGTESDGAALVIGTDSAVAIEGTPDELVLLLGRMHNVIEQGSSDRLETLTVAFERLADQHPGGYDMDLDSTDRFVLVEIGRDGQHHLTPGATPQAALDAAASDEEAGRFWLPLLVYDLLGEHDPQPVEPVVTYALLAGPVLPE